MLGNKNQLMNALLQKSFWKMSDQLLICLFVFLYTNLHKKYITIQQPQYHIRKLGSRLDH